MRQLIKNTIPQAQIQASPTTTGKSVIFTADSVTPMAALPDAIDTTMTMGVRLLEKLNNLESRLGGVLTVVPANDCPDKKACYPTGRGNSQHVENIRKIQEQLDTAMCTIDSILDRLEV